MAKKNKIYTCHCLINRNSFRREFEIEEQAVIDSFTSFLSDKDYGGSVKNFEFSIYIEPNVNFGHHEDLFYGNSVRATVNIRPVAELEKII